MCLIIIHLIFSIFYFYSIYSTPLHQKQKNIMHYLYYSCFLCFFLISKNANAQSQQKEINLATDYGRAVSTLYFEALGNGIIYSLNYDHLLIHSGKEGLSLRTGLSLYPVKGTTDFPRYVVPIEFNYLVGNEKMLELGIGANFLNYGNNIWPSFRIGYRKQRIEGGYFFRIGFLLARVQYDDDSMTESHILPTLGVGFGYTVPKS